MTTLKPEPSLEKEKRKGRAGREFPVTFVVDQQLEACVDAIGQNSNHYDVEIKVLNHARQENSVAFSAVLFQDAKPIQRFRGTLRRWQGTTTKVEAQMSTIGEAVLPGWLTFVVVVNLVFPILYLMAQYQRMSIFSAMSFSEFCMLELGLIVTAYALASGHNNHVRFSHIQRLHDALKLRPDHGTATE